MHFLVLPKCKTTLLNIIVQFQLHDDIHRREDGRLFAWSPHLTARVQGSTFWWKKSALMNSWKSIIVCGIPELFNKGEMRMDLLLLQRSFLDQPFYSKEWSNLSTFWMINSLLVKGFIYHKQWKKYRKKNQYVQQFSPAKAFLKEKPQSRLKEQLMQSQKSGPLW